MDDVRDIDAWCAKQAAELSRQCSADVLAGVPLDDPQYRHRLGQHTAFMRMRSYLHGAVRALLSEEQKS